MPTVLVAVGQTIVVLTRGIDLSVGGMIDLSNTLAATQMQDSAREHGRLVASRSSRSAPAFGALNGVLVAYGRLQPILVTLATLAILQGLALRTLPEPGGVIPPSYSNALANPNGPWSLLFVARGRDRLAHPATHDDRRADLRDRQRRAGRARPRNPGAPREGRRVCALGPSGRGERALPLGDDDRRGRHRGRRLHPHLDRGRRLGGISFFGGRGSALGAIAGAFVLTILTNVLFFAGIDPLYQSFFQGLFLVVAVLLGAVLGRLLRGSA